MSSVLKLMMKRSTRYFIYKMEKEKWAQAIETTGKGDNPNCIAMFSYFNEQAKLHLCFISVCSY